MWYAFFEVFVLEDMRSRTAKRIKKLHIIIAVLTAFCLILCVVGIISLNIVLKREDNYKSAIKRLNSNISEKQRIINEDMISKESFKDYAARYGVSTHFIQQFIDDAIVYKNDYGIAYSPIDESLTKNGIDTSKISDINGRKEFTATEDYEVKTAVDVSSYQGYINWSSVAADGIDCAFIRVGYRGYSAGDIVTDSYYSTNIRGALDAGLEVGIYFFSQAITVDEAIAEADFVLSKISGYDVTLPIVFDMERLSNADARANSLTKDQITDITVAFCDRIKQAGYTPMVYGNIEWMCDYVELGRLEGYNKWFAQYSSRPFFPYEMYMWQYTEEGKVNGISYGADLNLVFIPKNQ